MRGWVVALSSLGIAVVGAGSYIIKPHPPASATAATADAADRLVPGEAIDWLSPANGAGSDRFTPDRLIFASVTGAADGANASSADAPSADGSEATAESEEEGLRAPLGPPPSIFDNAEPEPDAPAAANPAPSPAPSAEPATSAPWITDDALAPPASPAPSRPAAAAVEPELPHVPQAIECMAGCGAARVVYEAVPKPTYPAFVERKRPIALIAHETQEPQTIECLAGCYGASPRSYRARGPERGRPHREQARVRMPPARFIPTSARLRDDRRNRFARRMY